MHVYWTDVGHELELSAKGLISLALPREETMSSENK
jgi:hypothetical protein